MPFSLCKAAEIDHWHTHCAHEPHASAWTLPKPGIEEATRSMVLGLASYVQHFGVGQDPSIMQLAGLHSALTTIGQEVVARDHGQLCGRLIQATISTMADAVAVAIEAREE
jgi:hypothetical protein